MAIHVLCAFRHAAGQWNATEGTAGGKNAQRNGHGIARNGAIAAATETEVERGSTRPGIDLGELLECSVLNPNISFSQTIYTSMDSPTEYQFNSIQ